MIKYLFCCLAVFLDASRYKKMFIMETIQIFTSREHFKIAVTSHALFFAYTSSFVYTFSIYCQGNTLVLEKNKLCEKWFPRKKK